MAGKIMWRISRKPLAAAGIFAGQMLYAIHRPDLPYFEDQDPTGVFGDPSLPPFRIVFLGDSTITSPGVDPLDACWARQTARHFASRHHVELISLAQGGSKAMDVVANQVDAVGGLDADLAFLSVGGNDGLRFTPIARFEEAYEQIISRLVDAAPAVAVSGVGDLGMIPRLPSLARGASRVRGRSIDSAIARVVSRYPGVVKSDTWHPMWDAFYHDLDLWGADRFHASAKGHELFSRAAIPAAEAALTASRTVPARSGSVGSST
jgi:lysophospholipase L1-like esterase